MNAHGRLKKRKDCLRRLILGFQLRHQKFKLPTFLTKFLHLNMFVFVDSVVSILFLSLSDY